MSKHTMGWGAIKYDDELLPVAELLMGWEGRMIPAHAYPIIALLKEYKKMSLDYEGMRSEFKDLLERVELKKQNIEFVQQAMNSMEESLDKLLSPELIATLKGETK